MKLQHLHEPRLQFAKGEHICPRKGITEFGVYDLNLKTRRGEVILGSVGTAACNEALAAWIGRCGAEIPGAQDSNQPNLRVLFPGFQRGHGFDTVFVYNEDLARALKRSDVEAVVKIKNRTDRLSQAIDLYYEQAKFLAQNRPVDVILCVIPANLFKVIASDTDGVGEETLGEAVEVDVELNFRRALKARTMHLGKPLQLIQAVSLEDGKGGQQDPATKAWNFCTALYYKAGARVPWKLASSDKSRLSCAVGIAFYRSRDRHAVSTSLAQIFDELGNGLILRGTPVDIRRDDRVPHLTSDQAFDLITAALREYRVAMGNYPARLVVHKSSNFDDDEIEGLQKAANAMHIDSVDLVTVLDSRMRLLRDGAYPPFRGTRVSIEESRHVLYTRGSVWYYQTYTGMYIPSPLELRIVQSEQSADFIASEILGLTKMNWNNTQFDGKYPVTLGCARRVGEIMKYLPESETPQVRYGFYM